MLTFLLFALSVAVSADQPSARVDTGVLAGARSSDSSVVAFKGVPFAAPPVGDLRWRPPQPPAAWTGVRKADEFSANCMQAMRESLGPWTSEYQPHGTVSEDCLYLNIWAPAKPAGKKLPVLVYFHGGAFTDGSGNVPVYDGENLAKKGVVVVTPNYRVGVMGFLALPELTRESAHKSSGNYGLLDQVAALQWIKKNIAAFGGDPAQVTIMGQSAGAASVHFLTASPLAKGLFVRAIAESGFGIKQGPGQTLTAAEQNGLKFAAAKSAASLKALRAMPASDVIAPAAQGFRFPPIVDGWFLPDTMDAIFAAGKQDDVATLGGWTADESSFNDTYGKLSAEEFRKQVDQQAGAHAAELLKLYPASTEAECSASQKAFSRDVLLVTLYRWASDRARTSKTEVYTYLFTHAQPGPTKERYMAFHSSELPYVFDNLKQANRPWTPEDRKLAATLSAYWVNFIKTGDPNGPGLPKWPVFAAGSPTTMELGDRLGPRPLTTPEKLRAIEKMLRQ